MASHESILAGRSHGHIRAVLLATSGQKLMALDNATTNNKSSGVGPGATGSHSCYPIDPHALPKVTSIHPADPAYLCCDLPVLEHALGASVPAIIVKLLPSDVNEQVKPVGYYPIWGVLAAVSDC